MAVAMARFGLSLLEAKRLTWHDYCIYDLAHQVKMQEEETMLAKQAWFNQAVKATKGTGQNVRSAYKSFKDFYDAGKAFDAIFDTKPKKPKLSIADLNRVINE
ncbi:TPA: hypothetical protein TUW68_000600 [Streptococcus equi subsp. zooepidemicus]|nr:hypothetical protein [Streptococcus equi subsp. zooepidemicus]HEK9115250.1 hypothetical protein [Streptococcus equi subsp. equi]MCD3394052.1 hypothetical protein [Streptococcus equi subsp. zooepidemicus]HEK9987517.1 hypothetical protein [Streptococcus equi subsp. zooepidemicus]HEL0644015.1 hypothetical protein [Streptococcus equi subsp. zooepidemicus]